MGRGADRDGRLVDRRGLIGPGREEWEGLKMTDRK